MDEAHADGMGIAELARKAGVTPRTIRYYVVEGLLPAPAGQGQRRAYGQVHLDRLEAIRELKAAYLPLHEIRRRLGDDLPPGGHNALRPYRRGAGTEDAGRLGLHPDGDVRRKPAPTKPGRVGAGFQTSTPSTALPNLPASATSPSTDPPNLPASPASTPSTTPPNLPASPVATAAMANHTPIGFGQPPGVGRIEIYEPAETVWRRHVLAQGVELHVRETDDPKLAEAIQRLLREAAAILDGTSGR